MPEKTLTLKEFDLDKIPPGAVVIIIGRRYSGKSWAIRAIMYMLYLRGMPYGAIFSGTEHCSPFFKKYFPDAFIHTEEDFTDETIGEILKKQGDNCRAWVDKIEDCSCLHCRKNPYSFDKEKGHCIHNNMMLITDDMMSQERMLKKSAHYRKIYTEGRHFNVLYLACLQYCMGLPPELRSNIDYVFLYGEDENSNLKKLYENYAGIFPTFQMFKDVLDQCTENYGCLVIDKRSKSKNLTDRVFYFRAKNPGQFKFGNRRFWEQHENIVGEQRSRNKPMDHRTVSKTGYERGYDKKKEFSRSAQKIFETYGEMGRKYTIKME